jgi:hypothetical protein
MDGSAAQPFAALYRESEAGGSGTDSARVSRIQAHRRFGDAKREEFLG